MDDLSWVWTVGGFGVLFTGIPGWQLLRARWLRGRGVPAQAVVMAQQGGELQRPVLAFTTRDGRTVRVTSSVGGNYSEFLPGRTVILYYDPADPESVSVPAHEAGVLRILLAAGLLMLGLVAGYAVFGDRMEVLIYGIPLFLGAGFLGIGLFGVGRVWRVKHGGSTDGVVVGAIASESRNGLPAYHAVIRYFAPDGTTIEVPSMQGHFSRPPAPGTRVRVCYDPASPQRMMLAHEHAETVFWIFGISGLLVSTIGVIVLVAVLF